MALIDFKIEPHSLSSLHSHELNLATKTFFLVANTYRVPQSVEVACTGNTGFPFICANLPAFRGDK
jgi:hypothetical protein